MAEADEAASEDTIPQTWVQRLAMGFLLHYVPVLGLILIGMWGFLWLFLFSFMSAGPATVLSLLIPSVVGMGIILVVASRGIEHLLASPPQDISDEVRDSILHEFADKNK